MIQGNAMRMNRRRGAGAIPHTPERYINQHQVQGLIVLKKFGWKLICIRRNVEQAPSIVLKNRFDGSVGVLLDDGILKLQGDLKVRQSALHAVEIPRQDGWSLYHRMGLDFWTGPLVIT